MNYIEMFMKDNFLQEGETFKVLDKKELYKIEKYELWVCYGDDKWFRDTHGVLHGLLTEKYLIETPGLKICELLGVKIYQRFDVYDNGKLIGKDVFIEGRNIASMNGSDENLFYALGKLVLGQARLVVKND